MAQRLFETRQGHAFLDIMKERIEYILKLKKKMQSSNSKESAEAAEEFKSIFAEAEGFLDTLDPKTLNQISEVRNAYDNPDNFGAEELNMKSELEKTFDQILSNEAKSAKKSVTKTKKKKHFPKLI